MKNETLFPLYNKGEQTPPQKPQGGPQQAQAPPRLHRNLWLPDERQ